MSFAAGPVLSTARYGLFRKLARVLEHFVASAPEQVKIAQLANHCRLSRAETRRLCTCLHENGLILGVENRGLWQLAKPSGEITLEDAWRISMSATSPAISRLPASTQNHQLIHEMDLLISQALLNIDQTISSQLRCVQLDRISHSQRHGRRLGRRGVKKIQPFL